MVATYNRSTDDLAFNIRLVAYDHNLSDRSGKELLLVQKLTRIPNIANLLQDEDVQVPDVEPSRQELAIIDDDDEDAIVGVWIGMRPSKAMEYRSRASASQPKGTSVNINEGFICLEHDPDALRVVAPLRKLNANYYSLINQDEDNALCQGVLTPIDEVFFFPEFRDDVATSWDARKATWAARVREVCVGQPVTTDDDDDDKIGNTEHDGNDGNVDNMEQDESRIYKLITTQKPLNLQECAEILREIEESAPEFASLGIEGEEIQELSRSICGIGTVTPSSEELAHAYLRGFILGWVAKGSKEKEVVTSWTSY